MRAIQNEILKRIIETNRMDGDVHVFQFQYISEQLNTRFLEQYPFKLFPANRKDQKRLGLYYRRQGRKMFTKQTL